MIKYKREGKYKYIYKNVYAAIASGTQLKTISENTGVTGTLESSNFRWIPRNRHP